MKIFRVLRPAIVVLILGCDARRGSAQPSLSLPVYQVTQSGATAAQAGSLASGLGIPASSLSLTNGLLSFIDPTNYLAIPTTPMTDATVISNLLAGTKNEYPTIPISFNAIDFAALSSLPVMDSNLALSTTSNAFALAGINLQFGTPFVGHTTFTAFYTNSASNVVSNSQNIDTEVSYRFAESNRYLLVGPGAQAQVTYGPTGNVTRLIYAARQLTAGPMVQIISTNEAANRFARVLPANAQMSLQLVYWNPAFQDWHSPSSAWNPANIIPWYACRAVLLATNPVTLVVSTTHLKTILIPATDDPSYVPSINLSSSTSSSGQVLANVSVTGGAPPYTYLWAGSEPTASTNLTASISYTPTVRVAPPPLSITFSPSAALPVNVSWPYPSTGFVLETTSSLASPAWAPVTITVSTNSDLNYVGFTVGSQPVFFRLALGSPTLPQTETLAVTVTDANGIAVETNQTFAVQALPGPVNPAVYLNPGGSYGCKSPNDPGEFADSRIGWQEGMSTPNAGGGSENFCWLASSSWPGDYIKPVPPGKLPANPWINGDADFSNWGINSANIVLINADAYADHINDMAPGFVNYPASDLWNPSFQAGTVDIDNKFYQVPYDHSWGTIGPNDRLDWLCGLLCFVLEPEGGDQGLAAWQRWGPAFGGLHIFTGFATEAMSGGAFPKAFAENLLGVTDKAIGVDGTTRTLVQAWWAGARNNVQGTPAALGPVGPNQVSDFGDYYWGKGAVGPTILPAQITGWWYLHGPDPLQFFP